MVYTNRFLARHAACARGALSAVLRPTSLSTLSSTHNLDATLLPCTHLHGSFALCVFTTILCVYVCACVSVATVQRLSESGRIAGRVDRGLYTPQLHTQQQRADLRSFLSQNGYIGMVLQMLLFTYASIYVCSYVSFGCVRVC